MLANGKQTNRFCCSIRYFHRSPAPFHSLALIERHAFWLLSFTLKLALNKRQVHAWHWVVVLHDLRRAKRLICRNVCAMFAICIHVFLHAHIFYFVTRNIDQLWFDRRFKPAWFRIIKQSRMDEMGAIRKEQCHWKCRTPHKSISCPQRIYENHKNIIFHSAETAETLPYSMPTFSRKLYENFNFNYRKKNALSWPPYLPFKFQYLNFIFETNSNSKTEHFFFCCCCSSFIMRCHPLTPHK